MFSWFFSFISSIVVPFEPQEQNDFDEIISWLRARGL